ncbi:hypothetical protein K431DRAFT_284812 [Polychaeton citri CBS 116435]|uniref:diphosphoinositol-polyphosphate diphosphatase n=1 Tax=Polychaeton citri CBS 116435 TaxID=1314669 RepID=A0A9P4UQV9_9PEZI|nr:hypothetical protein K431DRAFT_284812 [Polychaeton citri CBS 116435]
MGSLLSPTFDRAAHRITTSESCSHDAGFDEGNDMYFRTGNYAGSDDALEAAAAVDEKSRPPSPPSRETTPPDVRKRHANCPPRLKPLTPPVNYGTVTRDKVFRSAFPAEKNVDFMRSIGIKSIVCLVDTEPSQAYTDYVDGSKLACFSVQVEANKEGRSGTTAESMYEALMFILDGRNHPVMIHCNQGRHRTGCLVACLRLMQGWSLDDAIIEYNTYASPKSRPGDIAFIRSFDTAGLLCYARENGHFDREPLRLADPSTVTTLDSLLEVLKHGGVPPLDSSSSDRSDSSIQTNLSSGTLAQSAYSAFDPTRPTSDVPFSKAQSFDEGDVDYHHSPPASYADMNAGETQIHITPFDEDMEDADDMDDAFTPWAQA